MELDILKLLIEKRNKVIDKKYVKKPSYNYLVETRDDLTNNIKVLTSYLHLITNKPVEECEEIIKALKVNEISFTEAEFTVIVDFFINLKENSSLEYVKEFFQTNNLVKEIMYWKKMKLDNVSKANITVIKSLTRKHKADFVGLISLLEKNYEAFLDICNLIIECKAKNSNLTIARAKKVLYARMAQKKENGITPRKENRTGRISLEEAKQKIKKHVENIELEEKNHYKQIKLETYYNNQILEVLERELKKKEITNARQLVKKITDQEIKEIILLIIYKHNLAYLEELKQEYENLSSNSTNKYLALLHEHGITISEENLGNIKNNKYEDVEEILNTLKNLNIKKDSYINILTITNKETIDEIKELLNKGLISKTILSNNIDIFNLNNNQLNIIKNNIQLFNKYQVNPTIFSENEDILLMENNLLEQTLYILEKYNLTKSIKSTTDFNFFFNKQLNFLIDKYLELGYEKLLEEDLDVLNYQDTRRIEILRNMGFELTKEELVDMYENNKFFIPDEMLDNYIPTTISYFYKDDLKTSLEELMKYQKTSRTLEINGCIISINKVLNALENNMSIKEAILLNMNMDINAYEALENELNGIQYNK